jgi:hypothetical protein
VKRQYISTTAKDNVQPTARAPSIRKRQTVGSIQRLLLSYDRTEIGAFHSERRELKLKVTCKSEDIERNPKADSHPGTNQA